MRVELCSLQDQSRTFSLEISPCVSQQRKEVRTSDKQLLWFSPLCSTVQKEPIATQKKYRRQFSSEDSTHNLRITEFSHDNSTKKESTIVYYIPYTFVSMIKFLRSSEPTIIKSEDSLQGETCQYLFDIIIH